MAKAPTNIAASVRQRLLNIARAQSQLFDVVLVRFALERLLWRQRMTGPAIARMPGMARSTVGLILRRLGLGRLAALDPKPPVIRYERSGPAR